MSPALITGASGFVGRALLMSLGLRGFALRPVYRSATQAAGVAGAVVVLSLDDDTDWSAALQGVEVVIHTAARAHLTQDAALNPMAEYRRVNVEGTLNLARQAAVAGVQRLVFISSIGVNGLATHGTPFTADDVPAPVEPYAVSKWEAEQGLYAIAAETGMEVVVIRSPLVYGQHAPGNFGRLISSVRRGAWLPLGAVHNRRTLVALENLIDLLVVCVHHPAAANQTFLVGDAEDVSTTVLLQRIGRAIGRPARLLPIPVPLIRAGARLFGKAQLVDRVCGDLQVDIRKTESLLGWRPIVDMQTAMRSWKN
ncbi:MAG TPA: NAD-dependent epimerase/dehydratase family protein [Ottowia sp.]|uniref:NAD-dependent epimerase/dehydratase family protein n=1 Tax=Ottowia sp. TaxID=1898956 RepID=UPI002B7D3F5E|nr:NAD-dependent epimerase/dehydratase family protein [Ottowia sp.]HMN20918.1 NAD-dependent epimerase/dehydratase family protein [Ottowia sp.]